MTASELYTLAIEEYKQISISCTLTLRDYCKERHICYNGIQCWMSRHSIKVVDLKPRPVLPEVSASAHEQASCEGQQIYPKFGATKTPHVFLLDREKTVKYVGAIDNNAEDASAVTERYLENAIAALESGKNPEPAVTKAIGCSIKVKK